MGFNFRQINNQLLNLEVGNKVSLTLKREDLIHPKISGNKYRKLKYNLLAAKEMGCSQLLTFGGAYSNHIAAVAAAGNELGFKTVGVIRGEELETKVHDNPTLSYSVSQGMRLKFITRSEYRQKTDETVIDKLKKEFGDFYLIPEGGTNELAVKGCEEILTQTDKQMDFICCPVGTGGTISGLINSSGKQQTVLGFPALKGDFLSEDIRKFANHDQWKLITDYHFGGYGKINQELIGFINRFKSTYQIPLDPIYTGKMMFGIFDLIEKGYFPEGSTILSIHTGGVQGIEGMNQKLKTKNLPLIK